MNAILDLTQLRQTSMTPRLNDEQRRGPSSNDRTLQALASLPPAEDPELTDALELTEADMDRLQALATNVSTARDALTEAEAAHAVARQSSLRLESLERQAGASAAQAFRGGKDDQQRTKALAADIADCKLARSALGTLKDDVDAARDRFHQARGMLHGATVKAIKQMQLRASKRYADLALEVTRCVAAIEAGILALPGPMQADISTSWHAHTLAGLNLPAMPPQLRLNNQGVVEMFFRDSLLQAQHARLTCHTTDATAKLQAQLRDALAGAGMTPRSLLG